MPVDFGLIAGSRFRSETVDIDKPFAGWPHRYASVTPCRCRDASYTSLHLWLRWLTCQLRGSLRTSDWRGSTWVREAFSSMGDSCQAARPINTSREL